MSLESIKIVTDAEEKAREKLESAKNYARNQINEATVKGKELTDELHDKARAENKKQLADAEAMAALETKAMLDKTAGQCEAVEAKATSRLDAAAQLIVGRIVNG